MKAIILVEHEDGNVYQVNASEEEMNTLLYTLMQLNDGKPIELIAEPVKGIELYHRQPKTDNRQPTNKQ